MDVFLQSVAQIAQDAARAIMRVRDAGFMVQRKQDASPVTEADMAAHGIVVVGLSALTPEIPVISEENETHPATQGRFWCVDPLDGTRSFARGEGEFTVNIALVEQGVATLGIIACPLDGSCYAGAAGKGAWRMRGGAWTPIHASGRAAQGGRAIIGSHHISAQMRTLLGTLRVSGYDAMSSARKFCVLAEGGADVYPRFAPTYEWDTAAGQALLDAAGGHMTTMEGGIFRYNKPDYANGSFIAYGTKEA